MCGVKGNAFEPGTVVQLKSGGPQMVVGEESKLNRGLVPCHWLDSTGGFHSVSIAPACLQHAASTDDVGGHERACMLYRGLLHMPEKGCCCSAAVV